MPDRMVFLMLTRLLKAKLHHAVVTQTNLEYHGSITIDSKLLKASGLLPYEMVLIADCENGNRFETYILPGKSGSGIIGINGAAARLSAVGHRVIIISHAMYDAAEIASHKATVLVLNPDNTIQQTVIHRAAED